MVFMKWETCLWNRPTTRISTLSIRWICRASWKHSDLVHVFTVLNDCNVVPVCVTFQVQHELFKNIFCTPKHIIESSLSSIVEIYRIWHVKTIAGVHSVLRWVIALNFLLGFFCNICLTLLIKCTTMLWRSNVENCFAVNVALNSTESSTDLFFFVI